MSGIYSLKVYLSMASSFLLVDLVKMLTDLLDLVILWLACSIAVAEFSFSLFDLVFAFFLAPVPAFFFFTWVEFGSGLGSISVELQNLKKKTY